ncbi:MAG TPA: hypothetical protein VGE26_09155 [Sphingobacteriaceae bacterium]
MSTELKIIGPEDLQGASLVLATNISYVTTYQTKSEKLLEKAQKEGVKLTPETDAEINKFLVSAKTCHKKMEEDRKPFTSKLNEVISLFTAQENKLIKEIYPKLQQVRDASVTAYAKEERERQAEEQRKLDQQKERITLLADAEQQLRNAYADILSADKAMLLSAFESADASTIDEVQSLFETCTPKFTQEQFDDIVLVISSRLISSEEVEVIKQKAKEGKYEKIQPHYVAEIKNYANHLLTLIPGRREEIAKGGESKAAEELRRKEAEALAQQQAISDQRAEQQLSNQIAEAVVDTQIAQAARAANTPNAKAIESYTITVTKREGWAEIFKFYFNYSDEQDLGKIKLDQMKTFAERLAKSQGIKIESDAVHYETKFKATARKAA